MIRKIQIWFLKQELKAAGDFFIGGYQNGMVYVRGKYLKGWRVEQIKKWMEEGKIKPSIFRTIYSPYGKAYTDQLYKFKS